MAPQDFYAKNILTAPLISCTNGKGAIRLEKRKLKFTFHNPNSAEETVKYISALLAEIAVSKVIKAQETALVKAKKAV